MRSDLWKSLLGAKWYGLAVTLMVGLVLPAWGQESPPLPDSEQPAVPPLPVELIDPSPHLPGLPGWIMILLILLVLAIAAGLVVLIIRLGSQNGPLHPPRISPYIVARKNLEAFRELPNEIPLAEISTRISLVLRAYLAESKSDSALYQTREEFLTDEDRLRHVPEPTRGETAAFLAELSSLQYAPPSSDATLVNGLIDRSLEVLEALATPMPTSADHA